MNTTGCPFDRYIHVVERNIENNPWYYCLLCLSTLRWKMMEGMRLHTATFNSTFWGVWGQTWWENCGPRVSLWPHCKWGLRALWTHLFRALVLWLFHFWLWMTWWILTNAFKSNRSSRVALWSCWPICSPINMASIRTFNGLTGG